MRRLEIEIPMLVPRELTLNKPRGVHWTAVTEIKQELQVVAYNAAMHAVMEWEVGHRTGWFALKAATINYKFIVPDKRHIKDDDNAISGAKYMLDALQYSTPTHPVGRACIIIDDRSAKIGTVTWVVDKDKAPLTIIEVIEREENED